MSAVCEALLPPASRMITAASSSEIHAIPWPNVDPQLGHSLANPCDVAWIARCQAFDARLDPCAAVHVAQGIQPSREALGPTHLDHRLGL